MKKTYQKPATTIELLSGEAFLATSPEGYEGGLNAKGGSPSYDWTVGQGEYGGSPTVKDESPSAIWDDSSE